MSGEPTTPQTQEARARSNGFIYGIVAVVVFVLLVASYIAWSPASEDRQAQAKAEELVQKYDAAGLSTPEDTDGIVRALGNDGGAVCENPSKALATATLYDLIANGASFVGRRPVILDRRALLGQALILEVYCPEQLEKFQDKIDELKFDSTLEG